MGCAMQKLLAPREAATALGVSYATLKKWVYDGKVRTEKTRGGHHRVPQSEILRLIPKELWASDTDGARREFRKTNGWDYLIGRVIEVKYDDLLAQVTLAIDGHRITSIITADAAKELQLKPGERAAALVKSTEIMVLALKAS